MSGVDYAIPGTPATSSANTCSFTYESSSGQKVGTFFSPRHPSYYPDGTNCKYEFRGLNSEQVRLTFENFDVENGNASGTVYVRRDACACALCVRCTAMNTCTFD